MKLTLLVCTQLIFLTSFSQYSSSQEEQSIAESCPPAFCEDPVLVSNSGKECPSCEASRCKFRGCVHYGAFGPTWMPDNCTICRCENHQESCTTIECDERKECYGYPLVKKQGQCCEECDFGISKDDCGVMPEGTKSLYAALGDQSCQRDVVLHRCDKRFMFDRNEKKWYWCVPVMSVKSVSFKDNEVDCRAGVKNVTYEDITACYKKEMSQSMIPQDYDPGVNDCNFYVQP